MDDLSPIHPLTDCGADQRHAQAAGRLIPDWLVVTPFAHCMGVQGMHVGVMSTACAFHSVSLMAGTVAGSHAYAYGILFDAYGYACADFSDFPHGQHIILNV